MDAFDKLAKALDKTTQKEFSARTGVPQAQLSMLRNRTRRPSLCHIPELNRALGTSLQDWLEGRVVPKSKSPKKRRAGQRAA